MADNMQAKQHKVIHRIDERLTTLEVIVLTIAQLASIMLFISGLAGSILTWNIDTMRGRLVEWDWFQISGIVVFGVLFLAGGVMMWCLRKERR